MENIFGTLPRDRFKLAEHFTQGTAKSGSTVVANIEYHIDTNVSIVNKQKNSKVTKKHNYDNKQHESNNKKHNI